uniref:Small ribosomal subunit protein uS8c n=1 Tax=Sciaphila thaidanica TaxID=2161793 RepID=A0A2R4PAJ4_9LILI|nr:ribosomal protein S8 [Sciaphila thaidanica]
MNKDIISNIITLIRNINYNHDNKNDQNIVVNIIYNNIIENIIKILIQKGFITNVRKYCKKKKNYLIFNLYKNKKKKIILKQISRSGVRIYSKYKKIQKILGGAGIIILSTSRGIMSNREAFLERIGGEILCYIY